MLVSGTKRNANEAGLNTSENSSTQEILLTALQEIQKFPESRVFRLVVADESQPRCIARKLNGKVTLGLIKYPIGVDANGDGKGTVAALFKVAILNQNPETHKFGLTDNLALKLIDSNDEEACSQLLNEYKVLRSINPDGSIRGLPSPPYGVICKGQELAGILMELYEGDYEAKLKQRTEDSTFIQRSREFKDMASGLNALHQQGYMHGDIKTHNLLYKQQSTVLVDFGRTKQVLTLRDSVEEDTCDFVYPYLPFEEGDKFNNLPADIEIKREELEEIIGQWMDISTLEDLTKTDSLRQDIELLKEDLIKEPNSDLDRAIKEAEVILAEIDALEVEFKMRAEAIDIFNLGVIFYMNAYTPAYVEPFEGWSVSLPYDQVGSAKQSQVFEETEEGESIPLTPKHDPSVVLPVGLKELMDGMLNPNPEMRHSMGYVVNRLQEIFPETI